MKRIIIIGTGPAGLMAATQLKDSGAEIILVDQKAAPGRKFLVAGDGGFNLTHSESLETFVHKYTREYIRSCVGQYPNITFRKYLSTIGIETFVGSSGKVFPIEPTKPIEVLNAWLKDLDHPNISWKLKTRLIDFDQQSVTLETGGESEKLDFDYLVFALGGSSWKKTGSDGTWLELFREKGIPVKDFEASNSGIELHKMSWISAHEGAIIKNVRVRAGESETAGDLVVTTYGLEGKPIYAANGWLRENDFRGAFIDFKPQLAIARVKEVLRNAKTVKMGLEELKLPVVVQVWLRESLTKDQFTNPDQLAGVVKSFEPKMKGLRPIDEVISTVGGVRMEAIDETGQLNNFPNVFCAGEMLDWDAPTGGYLLQGCVSTGFVVGNTILKNFK